MLAENKNVLSQTWSEQCPKLDKSKTKHDSVMEQLQANPKIRFIGEVYNNYYKDYRTKNIYHEDVNLIIAANTTQINPDKLNKLMTNLVSNDIELSSKTDAFTMICNGGLWLGKLYYDDIIDAPDIKSQNKIQRRTCVTLYPDADLAKKVYNYQTDVANGTIQSNQSLNHATYLITREQLIDLKMEKIQPANSKIIYKNNNTVIRIAK